MQARGCGLSAACVVTAEQCHTGCGGTNHHCHGQAVQTSELSELQNAVRLAPCIERWGTRARQRTPWRSPLLCMRTRRCD